MSTLKRFEEFLEASKDLLAELNGLVKEGDFNKDRPQASIQLILLENGSWRIFEGETVREHVTHVEGVKIVQRHHYAW